MVKAPQLGSPAPHNAAAQNVGAKPPAAQGPAPKLNPANIANGAGPAAPAPNQGKKSANERIIDLMNNVCAQEAKLQNVPAARVISCKTLPPETGRAAVVQLRSNAVDLLLEAAKLAQDGELGFVSPADTKLVGGALDASVRPGFRHDGLLLEETYCTLIEGAKRSLDGAASSYPLGPDTKHQHLLHASDLKFRYDHRARLDMLEVKGSSRDRIAAQREVMINTIDSHRGRSGPGMHMFSIAGVDRRGVAKFDYKAMYEGMLRQLAHAFTTAKSNKVKILVLTLSGSGEYSRESREPGAKPDRDYLKSLACAAADAIHYFGAGLSVQIPTHGAELDGFIEDYLKNPSVSPGLQGERYFDIKAAQLQQPAQAKQQKHAIQQKPAPQQGLPVPAAQPKQKQPGLIKNLLNKIPNIGKPNQQVSPAQPVKANAVPPVQKPVVAQPIPAKHVQFQAQMPAQPIAVVPPATPMQNVPLENRTMGQLSYQVEPANAAQDPNSDAAKALSALIGNGNAITLRLVHGLPAIADLSPKARFAINLRDPSKDGRALVSIRSASNGIELYEAVFSTKQLASLAKLVNAAPPA